MAHTRIGTISINLTLQGHTVSYTTEGMSLPGILVPTKAPARLEKELKHLIKCVQNEPFALGSGYPVYRHSYKNKVFIREDSNV